MHYLSIFFAFAIITFIAFINGGLKYIIDLFALLVIVVIPLLLLSVSSSKETIKSFMKYWRTPTKELATNKIKVLLEQYITYTYATGAILAVIGWIMLLNIFDIAALSTQRHMADAFLGLFYAMLIVEFKLRPMKNRVSNQLES